MAEHGDWAAFRERRMAEPGAAEAYDSARTAFELSRSQPPPRPDEQRHKQRQSEEPRDVMGHTSGL